MGLDKILAVSGKPGLYKIVTQTRTGAVVESLVDNKRITVGAHSNLSILSEIAIYTLTEEKPLPEVLMAIRDKENGKPTSISHKDGKDVLEEYFFNVLPDYDEDRVYASDIKKVVQWYNLLEKNDMLHLLTKGDDKEASEEE